MNTETIIGSLYVISVLMNLVYMGLGVKGATQVGENIDDSDIVSTLFIIFMPMINSAVALYITMDLINLRKGP